MTGPPKVHLDLLPGSFAVCRLPGDTPLPAWASSRDGFLSITRTREELSVTISEALVPRDIRCERDFRLLRVRGPLAFELTGVLAAIAAPLAEAGVSTFTISTFDTDYVLVREDTLDLAVAALVEAGHQVEIGGWAVGRLDGR